MLYSIWIDFKSYAGPYICITPKNALFCQPYTMQKITIRYSNIKIPRFGKVLVLVTVVMVLFTNNASGQLNQTDSLKNIIHSKTDKGEKLKAIVVLCENHESLPADTLYAYNAQAKQLAQQLEDDNKILETAYYDAVYLFKKNKLDSTLAATNVLLTKIKKQALYNNLLVNVFVLKFNAFWRKNNFNDAIATSRNYYNWPKNITTLLD